MSTIAMQHFTSEQAATSYKVRLSKGNLISMRLAEIMKTLQISEFAGFERFMLQFDDPDDAIFDLSRLYSAREFNECNVLYWDTEGHEIIPMSFTTFATSIVATNVRGMCEHLRTCNFTPDERKQVHETIEKNVKMLDDLTGNFFCEIEDDGFALYACKIR